MFSDLNERARNFFIEANLHNNCLFVVSYAGSFNPPTRNSVKSFASARFPFVAARKFFTHFHLFYSSHVLFCKWICCGLWQNEKCYFPLQDVSEESEYDLWSDRFGSWIGRSSKSRSPDSMKHLRYDRKSSSGYSSCSWKTCIWCFVFLLHATRTPQTASSHIQNWLANVVVLNFVLCKFFVSWSCTVRRCIVDIAGLLWSHRQAIQLR